MTADPRGGAPAVPRSDPVARRWDRRRSWASASPSNPRPRPPRPTPPTRPIPVPWAAPPASPSPPATPPESPAPCASPEHRNDARCCPDSRGIRSRGRADPLRAETTGSAGCPRCADACAPPSGSRSRKIHSGNGSGAGWNRTLRLDNCTAPCGRGSVGNCEHRPPILSRDHRERFLHAKPPAQPRSDTQYKSDAARRAPARDWRNTVSR